MQALTNFPNVNEAVVVAAKLQELLFSYNLTLADLKSEDKAKNTGHIKNSIDVGFVMGHTGDWRIILVECIARVNFFRAVFHMVSMTIIGERHNIIATCCLYEYLASKIVRFAKREWKTFNHGQPFNRERALAWVRPFC